MWEKIKQIIALPKVVEDNHVDLSRQLVSSVELIKKTDKKFADSIKVLHDSLWDCETTQEKCVNDILEVNKQLKDILKEYKEIKESLWIQSKQIWALIETHQNKDMYFGVYNKPETKKK